MSAERSPGQEGKIKKAFKSKPLYVVTAGFAAVFGGAVGLSLMGASIGGLLYTERSKSRKK